MINNPSVSFDNVSPETLVHGAASAAGTAVIPARRDHKHAQALVINSGTYSGNGAGNRAIPHGLGVTPKLVILTSNWSINGNSQGCISIFNPVVTKFYQLVNDVINTSSQVGVTAPDATNIYVGDGSNDSLTNNNSLSYNWIAIG